MAYDLGDSATPSIQIRDDTGVLANATTVTATITLPDGTVVTSGAGFTITNTGAGIYTATYTTTMAGLHRIQWVATGTNAGVHVEVFDVADASRTSVVPMSDVKKYLRLPAADVTSDDELRSVLEAATALCEDYTGRTYRRATFVETHDGGRTALALRRSPVQSVTSVTVSGEAVTTFVLDTGSGLLYYGTTAGVSAWRPGMQNIAVTYVAGNPTVSPRVVEAVLYTTNHLWAPRRGGSNLPRQTGADAEYAGTEPWALPRRAMQLLEPDLAPGIG